MEITHPGVVHQDQRGTIVDVLADLNFNYATVIMQKKGVVRGNHYHNDTTQFVYLVRGAMTYVSQFPGEEVRRVVMSPGDMVVTTG